MGRNKRKLKLKSPALEGTLPHQINSPSYKQSAERMKAPFINEFGVIIGDSLYDSPHSPLNNWSVDVDPAVMAGEQWVHPTNDIGNNSAENEDLIEEGIAPQNQPFQHPTKDVSYTRD